MRAALTLAVVLVLLLLAVLWTKGRTSARAERLPPAAEAPRAPAELADAAPLVPSGASQDSDSVTGERVPLSSASTRVEGGIVLEGWVLELAAGAALEGGAPAAGATVVRAGNALSNLGFDEDEPPPSATTAVDGSFRLVLPDEGKRPLALQLVVNGDERFRYASVKFRLEEGESRRSGLVLARYQHGELAGRTIDVRGQPVAGVEVVLLGWDEAGEEVVRKSAVQSDSSGAFRFGPVSDIQELEAKKPGYTLIEALRAAQHENGLWDPLEVVLAAEGVLRVLVLDPAGDPVPDVQVSAMVAAPERYGSTNRSWASLSEPRSARTDSSGTALLNGIWADQRLHISLFLMREGEDIVHLADFERLEDGKPVPEPESGGLPLVVEPGRERMLRIELTGRHRIRGRVLLEDGSAFREPWITVRTLDLPRFTTGSREERRRGDERGRFELELLALRPLGRVLVTASDNVPEAFGPASAPGRSAWAIVDLTVGSPSEELTLVMSATRAIAGRIVCDPPEVRVTVIARSSAGGMPFGALASNASRFAQSRKGGEFRLEGLPAGRYDLEFVPSERYPTVCVRDMEAGTEGVTVALEGTRPARVTVEVSTEVELAETILLTGKLHPHGDAPDVPELPAQATLREPRGWPPAMLQLWYGGGGRTDEVGWTSYSLVPTKENPTTVELDEGLYWIGVKAKAKDGSLTFPVGTGLMRVSAGDHRLRFELPPGASVEGHVTTAAPAGELCVALARGGRLLELDVRREKADTVAELGHDGWFRFPQVPVGELELRVGTRAELLEGRWLRREELRAARGATVSVNIEL